MDIFTLVICLVMCGIGKFQYKSIVNPTSVYSLSWILCLVCNIMLHWSLGIKPIAPSTYFMIITSVIVFSFTELFFHSVFFPRNRGGIYRHLNKIMEGDDVLNIRLVYILNAIAIISILPSTIETVVTLVNNGIYDARANVILGTGEGGITFLLKDLYKNAVIQPIFLTTMYVTIDTVIFSSNENKKNLLWLTALDILISTLTYLGRWLFLKGVIFVLFALIIRLNQRSLNALEKKRVRRIKKQVYIILGVFMLALVFITNQRTYTSDDSIINTALLYFGGSLNYLDLGVQEIGSDGYLLWGWGLFPSIWDNFINAFQKTVGIDFLRPQEIVYLYNAPIKSIGGELVFTGFGTVLMNMYLDGRWIGIIFDSIVLGVITSVFMRNMVSVKSNRMRVQGIYALLILSLVTIQWDGNSLSAMMVFVYLIWFYRKKKFLFYWGNRRGRE